MRPRGAHILDELGPRVTVVIASAAPELDAGVAREVALIDGGRLAAHGSVSELRQRGMPLTAGRAPAAGRRPMNRLATLGGLSLRELWIGYRLLLAVLAFALSGLVAAIAPAPGWRPHAVALALAIAVTAGLVASAVAGDRLRGFVGWLVARSVPRATVAVGWLLAPRSPRSPGCRSRC